MLNIVFVFLIFPVPSYFPIFIFSDLYGATDMEKKEYVAVKFL